MGQKIRRSNPGRGKDFSPKLPDRIYGPPSLIYKAYWGYFPRIKLSVHCVWNGMAHAQKPYFVFWWNGRVHLNRQGRQFSRLLAAEVCTSAVVMLDTPCCEVVWTVLATVQSTTGSRGVHISGSNAGYTMFRGSVKSTGYSSVDYWQPRCAHQRK
jgi:hypothetical protein